VLKREMMRCGSTAAVVVLLVTIFSYRAKRGKPQPASSHMSKEKGDAGKRDQKILFSSV
jgi:hypothetical protein